MSRHRRAGDRRRPDRSDRRRWNGCRRRWKRSRPSRWSRSPAPRPPSRSPSGCIPGRSGGGSPTRSRWRAGSHPRKASRRLHAARDLVLDMPHTLELLSGGDLSGWTVRLITEQTSHLDRATRTQRRHRPCRAATRDDGHQGSRRDRETARLRTPTRKRRGPGPGKRGADRRVTLRPAPDTMSLLSGLLPVEQGVACLAALHAAVTARKADGDTRSEGPDHGRHPRRPPHRPRHRRGRRRRGRDPAPARGVDRPRRSHRRPRSPAGDRCPPDWPGS